MIAPPIHDPHMGQMYGPNFRACMVGRGTAARLPEVTLAALARELPTLVETTAFAAG